MHHNIGGEQSLLDVTELDEVGEGNHWVVVFHLANASKWPMVNKSLTTRDRALNKL